MNLVAAYLRLEKLAVCLKHLLPKGEGCSGCQYVADTQRWLTRAGLRSVDNTPATGPTETSKR